MTHAKNIPLETQFLKHCRKFFKKGERILLAVSGGADSMVMAQLFIRMRSRLDLDLGIAHVNHGLRGRSADRDERFVKKFSEDLGIPFYAKRVNVIREARSHRRSKEEAARNLRYRFLDEVARKERYDHVCTAHHQSDQAETVLMRLIKGTGWQGLCGIREQRGKYVRPMLDFSKPEIEGYAQKIKLKFVIDASNAHTTFLRNRIRHEVLPLLKKRFDPQVEKHLSRLSAIAEDTYGFVRAEAGRVFKSVCHEDNGKIVLEIKTFNEYLLILRQAVIELIFERLDIAEQRQLTYNDFTRILDFIEFTQAGKRLLFPGMDCTKVSGSVFFQKKAPKKNPAFSYEIDVNRSYQWPERSLRFNSEMINPESVKFGESPFVEYIDAEKISGRLVLRNWRPGDSFYPLGMNRSKKLSDFFVDEKVPLGEKSTVPVFCERSDEKRSPKKEKVIWIGGHRLDERYKITPATKLVLKIECHWNERN